MRRYAPIAPSKGTQIPPQLRIEVLERDQGCVAFRAGLPDSSCHGALELDHVRASHGMGMKSETTARNLVTLCGNHHRIKTANGKRIRPLLLAYLERVTSEHVHVEPVPGCTACYEVWG